MWLSYTFLAILVLPLTLAFDNVDPKTICPPEYLINPCKCYKGCPDCEVELSCDDLQEQSVLTHVAEESNDYQYEVFRLKNSSIMYIPASLFQAKIITKMYVTDVSMVSLFNPPLSIDNQLKFLYLERVKVTRGYRWELFSTLRKIYFLRIQDVSIRRLDKTFTKMPNNIRNLVMINCSISKLYDYVFTSLNNTSGFTFERNNIKELKRSMFSVPSNVETFNFNENQIQTLPEDMFTDMPRLKFLFLEHNLISELKESVFSKTFPKLNALFVVDNPMKCKCEIRWIFKEIEGRAFKSKITGICASPKEQEGKGMRELRKEDFIHCG